MKLLKFVLKKTNYLDSMGPNCVRVFSKLLNEKKDISKKLTIFHFE